MAKLKDGFYKQTAESVGSDSYVLLAGGGSKPLTDFALSAGNYVTLDTTQTITGKKQFNNSIYILSGISISDENGNGVLGVKSKTWTGVPSDGTAISLGTLNNSLYFRSSSDDLYHYRYDKSDSGTKNAAYRILDASNYNDFAPTKTGGGASGTWSIDISGNASSARALACKSFDTASQITTAYAQWTNNSGCSDIPSMGYAAVLNVGYGNYRWWQIWNSRNDHQLFWRPEKADASDWAEVHILIDNYNISEYALTQHQSLANYVTLNGNQTITGLKTFTNTITLDYTYSNQANIIFKNNRATGSGGWNDDIISIKNKNDLEIGSISLYGTGDSLNYIYIGTDTYQGDNLRISSTGVSWGNNQIWHTGNLTKVSQLTNDSGFVTGGPYLPLSGGKLSNLKRNVLTINTTNSNGSYIEFTTNDATKGAVGNYADCVFLQANDSNGVAGPYLAVTSSSINWINGSNKYKIWHAGNDGSDSGLDADTTDGLHLYTRLLGVNGTNWTFASTANSNATTHIYAPTSAGTSGQVLTSSGGTPGWTNQSSLSVGQASRLGLNGIADSTTYGTYAGIYQSSSNGPESDNWHNSIKILHNNSSGYYTQLAQNFTGSHGLWHRSNRAGTISRWYRVLDDQGGTLLGDLILYNGGGSGDSPALIFQRNTITDTASQLDWKIYDTVGDLHFQNNYEGWHTAFKLNYQGGADLVGSMTATRFIASGSNQYKDSGGLVMSNSDIWGVNAIYTMDLAGSATEGYQFKRTNGNYDSIWAADGTFYFSPNGSLDSGYSTNYTVIHSGNIGSQSVNYANSAGNADTVDSKHASDFIQTSGQIISGKHGKLSGYHQENGWHRIATIDISNNSGYGSHILYLTGTWSHKQNTNAILHINTSHTTGKITQVSGHVGFTNKIRLVNVSSNKFYVDIHIDYTDNTTIDGDVPGTVYYYFLGNGSVTINDKVEKITDTVTAASQITLYQTEGNVFTSGNYTNWVNTTNFPGLNKTGTVTSINVGSTSYSPSSGVVSLPAYPTSLPANGGTATKATQDGDGNTISSTYLKKSGGTMTGNITFTNKGIVVVPGSNDQYIWKVYSSTDGQYGFKLQYDGTGAGNDNSLSLIADNQTDDKVIAYKILQDGTVSFTKDIVGSLSGNATSATKLATARTISLTGAVTGSGSFDGSANLSITTTLESHNHDDSYVNISGDTMTGNLYFSDNSGVYSSKGGMLAYVASSGLSWTGVTDLSNVVVLGTVSTSAVIRSSTDDLYHYNHNEGTRYKILDALNYSSYALPLSGGILSKDGRNILTIHDTNTSTSNRGGWIKFSSEGTSNYLAVGINTTAGSFFEYIVNGTTYTLKIDNYGILSYQNNPVIHSGNVSSYAITSRGYIGTTAVQANSATQNLTGIGSISSNANITTSKTDATYLKHIVSNSNGSVSIHAATNRGLYDDTNGAWIVYLLQDASHVYIPKWANKGSSTNPVYFNASGEPAACTYSLNKTVPSDAKFTDTNYYHTRAYSSGLKISTGTGVSDMYVPYATTSAAGVIKVGNGLAISSGTLSVSCSEGSGDVVRPFMVFNSETGKMYYTNKLTVNYSSGKISATGSIYAAAFYENSDIRLKHNIQYLQKNLLDKVYNVKEVSFNWNSDNTEAFGYIAQDYEKISKTFVSEKSDGTLSLNYTEVLVAQIAALKQKIANLEERFHILERS